VEIYLRRLEQLAKTHGWKKEQNISFLGVNYVGEALLWYQIKLMDEKTLTWTWSEWEIALRERFSPSAAIEATISTKLQQLCLGPQENVKGYNQYFLQLAASHPFYFKSDQGKMLSSFYANSLRSRPDLQQVALRKVIKGKALEDIMNHVELAALSNRDILFALDTERARINDRTAHWGDPTVQPHHLPMRPPSPRQAAPIAPLAPPPLSPVPAREGQKQSGNTDTLLQDLISQMQTLTLHIRGVPPQTYCTKCQSREHNAGTCPTNGYQYNGPYSFGYPPPPQPNAYYPHQHHEHSGRNLQLRPSPTHICTFAQASIVFPVGVRKPTTASLGLVFASVFARPHP
jgi:hypothetical protein